MTDLVRSENTKRLWQNPVWRASVAAGLARTREVRAQKVRDRWKDPAYRASRPNALPAMTRRQKLDYRKARCAGCSREDALKAVMG